MDGVGVMLSNRDLSAAASEENTGFERSKTGAEKASDESSTSELPQARRRFTVSGQTNYLVSMHARFYDPVIARLLLPLPSKRVAFVGIGILWRGFAALLRHRDAEASGGAGILAP